jgi:hypothetical protein
MLKAIWLLVKITDIAGIAVYDALKWQNKDRIL